VTISLSEPYAFTSLNLTRMWVRSTVLGANQTSHTHLLETNFTELQADPCARMHVYWYSYSAHTHSGTLLCRRVAHNYLLHADAGDRADPLESIICRCLNNESNSMDYIGRRLRRHSSFQCTLFVTSIFCSGACSDPGCSAPAAVTVGTWSAFWSMSSSPI
jgi:hypothetical protein